MEGPKVLRLANGESIFGFHRDFVRRMLWATNLFPQSQAVISQVIAWEAIKAIQAGRSDEVLALLSDLSDENRMPTLIDVEAIKRYTEEHYQQIGLRIPPQRIGLYIILMRGELRQAISLIAQTATVYVEAYNPDVATEINYGGRRPEVLVNCLGKLTAEELSRVEAFISVLVKQLTTDAIIKAAVAKFFLELRTIPYTGWGEVKRTYQTTIGDRAESILRNLAGLRDDDDDEEV